MDRSLDLSEPEALSLTWWWWRFGGPELHLCRRLRGVTHSRGWNSVSGWAAWHVYVWRRAYPTGKQEHRSPVVQNVLLLERNRTLVLFLQYFSFRGDRSSSSMLQRVTFFRRPFSTSGQCLLSTRCRLGALLMPLTSPSSLAYADLCISISEAYLVEGGPWPEKGFFLRAQSVSMADKIHDS